MEKKLYKTRFVINHPNGKTSPMLEAYTMADSSYSAKQIFIQTYSNGDESRFYLMVPPIEVKDPSEIKKLKFYNFRFRLKNEKGQEIGRMLSDLIPAFDTVCARELFLAKYSHGDEKKLWYVNSFTYRYDDLDRVSANRDVKTFEFYYQMKNDKGQLVGNRLTTLVDAVDTWEAREIFIAAIADGDEKKVWYLPPKEVGYALQTQVRKAKEAEKIRLKEEEQQKREKERKERIEAERIAKEQRLAEEKIVMKAKETERHKEFEKTDSKVSPQKPNTTPKKKDTSTNKVVRNPSVVKKTAVKTEIIKDEKDEGIETIPEKTVTKTKKSRFLFISFLISLVALVVSAVSKNSDIQVTGLICFLISFGMFFFTLLCRSIKKIFKRR